MKRTTRVLSAAAALPAAAVLTCGTGTGSATAAPPAPDLVVTAVGWAPTDPVPGSPVQFRAEIRNAGTAATPDGVIHGVQFKVAGVTTSWSDTWTFSLAPGDSVLVTANSGPTGSATWRAVQGTRTVTAEVDDARRIAESDERDNTRSRTLTVRPASGSGAVASVARTARAADGSTGLVVDHWLAAHNHATFVQAAVTGELFGACYRSTDQRQVPGTEVRFRTATVGSTAPEVSGPTEDHVLLDPVAASTTSTRARVGVSTVPLLRRYYGDPAQLGCPRGSAGAFSRWHVTRVESVRYLAGSSDQGVHATGTSSRPVALDLSLAPVPAP
ncbi:CARDB domain-containing protein [Kineococcus glutinatus]|uniref:CARDB domain-containing protein n=1 Tax=Kineococcus glutinatus TaxID=1070872 RepID=A0ABP9H7Y2_9ACTN